MWHVETDVFAIIIMVILLIKNARLKAERTEQDRLISIMLWCSVFVTVIDLVSSMVMNVPGGWWSYQIIMVLYYATATLLPCLWLLYGYMQIDGGKLHMTPLRFIAAVLPQLVIMLYAFSNPWTSWVFHLSENMEYSRGPAFTFFTMLYIVYYPIAGLLTIWVYRNKIRPKSSIIAMAIFFLIIPVSTVLQLKFSGTLLICLAFAVIYVIDDLTIETERRNSLLDQLKEQNKELERAVEAAEAASEAKTQFVSRISHDIRTPIGAILNLTEFAKEDMGNEEKLENDIEKIGTSGRFLLSLINDVLDISKIDSGKIELKYDRYPYQEYVSEIRNIIIPMCEEKGLGCEMDIEDSDVAAVMTDKVRLNQITLNLLSNAVKYTPKGGKVAFHTSLKKKEENKAEMQFTVEDTGIGMSQEFQKKMFEEFAQEDSPLRPKAVTGTGLGLSIVKKLIDLLNGTIAVDSETGKGTKITVTLPMEEAEAVNETEELKEQTAKMNTVYEGRILFAEDNAINTEIALRIFESLGLHADHAGNGEEALSIFRNSELNHYDVIFMDIQMPVMNGYEASYAIRQLEREDAKTIPIIAMTADAFEEAREKALSSGMTDFMTKPLKVDELRNMLDRLKEG